MRRTAGKPSPPLGGEERPPQVQGTSHIARLNPGLPEVAGVVVRFNERLVEVTYLD